MTMTLTVRHNNGNQSRYADTYADAIRMLKSEYGDEIVVNSDWESHSADTERLLVWASEESADNDGGSHAVAEIIRPALPRV